MLESFAVGLVGASSLVIGALLALWRPISRLALGLIMAFGSGVLVSSVAYELVGEAFATSHGQGEVAFGLIAGTLTFFVGDLLIDRAGGATRKSTGGEQRDASGVAIVLGTVLDGIPESIVLGVGVASGTDPSMALLVAVFVSNLPEAMSSTVGLRAAGWPKAKLIELWVAIAAGSGLAAAIGYQVFGGGSAGALAFVLAYAGGAVLTMLADTMMPEAFRHGGELAGVVTTLGFGIGFALGTLS